MLAIFKREVLSFFSSPIGYMVIGLFLLLNGLILWVFKGPFNIFDSGFADLTNFFLLTPWLFLFLIPAISMKSFSEERKMGTLELLFIKPITVSQLVLGKFLGIFVLALMALIPTLIYVFSVSELGTAVGNLDKGLVTGSYFGTLFLIALYTAIGLFSSTLSQNQILAFIYALLLSLFLYYGFEGISGLTDGGTVSVYLQNMGMKAHFENISRGILDVRDFIYFISLTVFFLFLTVVQLNRGDR